MSLKSMTGYGRAEVSGQTTSWVAEVRGTNHRYLDIKIKLPREYNGLEERVRKLAGRFHRRGRVDISLSASGDGADLSAPAIDYGRAMAYKKELDALAGELGISDELTMFQLVSLPDVIKKEQASVDIEEAWNKLNPALENALGDCLAMRTREADMLTVDLRERVSAFTSMLNEIEAELPAVVAGKRETLRQRINTLLDEVEIDPVRLAQEVAYIVEKSDVTEEIVRLRSHLEQFDTLLAADDPVGRTMDFLIQEFLREVNTMASKLGDAAMARKTVELKGELEKIREQVQNIE
jgi:uncharacterized protein (TIGR00255 family)